MTCADAAGRTLGGGTATSLLILWKYRPLTVSERDGEQIGV